MRGGGDGAADGSARAVAIKVIHPHLAQDPEIVAMFLDEARVTTRMDHPNIIDVCDVDMVGDELVIVMAYVEGIALSRLLRAARNRTETLPISVALRILHDSLLGLHAAHELTDEHGERMEIVHRDVSPHNLLVGTDGVTRVTDFGVATSAGRLASTRPDGSMKGKLQYLAPEQVYRRPLDRKVDIFSAGIVFWEALTGRRLFSGGTEAETLAMVLRDPIAPPSAFRPEVSSAIDEVCLRALERDPTRRFSTAAEFAAALEDAGA
ncbi:MAG: serine/threonine-protein kinase, partial [Polyangiaceae bacterium]